MRNNSMLKIIHAADFHLDSPFSGLRPEDAAKRRSEQRLLLRDLTELVKEEQADLVLLSGDIMDSGLVYRETLQALSHALEEMGWRRWAAPSLSPPAITTTTSRAAFGTTPLVRRT